MTDATTLDAHILNIVQTKQVTEQSELQKQLEAKGYDVPQATLSRRLKKLHIAKVGGVYKLIDFNMPNLPLVLSMQVSAFGLIVLHTPPGNANSVASFIDQKYVSQGKDTQSIGLLGTIAGDDTLLLICRDQTSIEPIKAMLKQAFPYLTE